MFNLILSNRANNLPETMQNYFSSYDKSHNRSALPFISFVGKNSTISHHHENILCLDHVFYCGKISNSF